MEALSRRTLRPRVLALAVAVLMAFVLWLAQPGSSAAVRLQSLALAAAAGLAGAIPVLAVVLVIRLRGRRRRGRRYLVPKELPPPPTIFVGRDTAFTAVVGLLRSHRRRWRPLVVVVHGAAGVGKSGFAVKAATSVIEDFPGGAVYASLTGATPGSARVYNVLGDLVDSLQGPGDVVPASMAGRIEELRRLTRRRLTRTGRRVLFVFDDVLSADVVAAMMPRRAPAAVLITSRERLEFPGVRATMAWQLLNPLPSKDAMQLLRQLLGPRSPDAGNESLLTIVRSAAGYPLALHLAARAISNRGLWALQEITPAADGPAPTSDDELARATMLDLSIQLLDETQRRTLISLALLPGVNFVPWMAQALSGMDREDDAWIVCERLADQRLLQRVSADATGVVRMRLPERVRDYIKIRVVTELTDEFRQAALARLDRAFAERARRDLDHVLDVQIRNDFIEGNVSRALDGARTALADARERSGRTGMFGVPGLEERRALAALAEVLAELGGFDDALEIALADRRARAQAVPRQVEVDDAATAQAARSVGRLRRRQWRLDEAVAELHRAAAIATRIGAVDEAVLSLRELAIVQSMRPPSEHSIEEAYQTLRSAHEALPGSSIADVLGSRLRHADAIVRINHVDLHDGQPDLLGEAARELDDALAALDPKYRLWRGWIVYHRAQVAHRQATAPASPDVLAGRHQAGRRLAEARLLMQESLAEFSDMNHRYGRARCRLELGRTYADERPDAALPLLEEARETFILCGDRWIEASTALDLARIRLQLGGSSGVVDWPEAAEAELSFAEQIFTALHDLRSLAHVHEVRTSLPVTA